MENPSFPVVLVLILVLLVTVFNCNGFPDGAPKNRKVCKNLHPHHHEAKSQKTPSPYSVVPEKNKIASGTSVQVKIVARPGLTFKGFIMQARHSFCQYKPIGTFRILDSSLSKTIDCYDIFNNTVTHSSSALKNMTAFMWTPPAKYKGPVIFKSTVVQNYSTFWTNVSAKISVGDSNEALNSSREANELVPDFLSSEEDAFDSEVGQLNRRIYKECGVTKTCFGVPDDCIYARSCDALVTVVARDSKYEFEMTGTSYVAVSLSEDGRFNEASATECVLVDNAVVRLYQSKRYDPDASYDGTPTYKGLELINSSYWDGMVYCKFVRDEVIELDGVEFNFRSKKYSILLASESVDSGRSKDKIDFDYAKFHCSRQSYLSNVSGFLTSPQPVRDWKMCFAWGVLIFELMLALFLTIYP